MYVYKVAKQLNIFWFDMDGMAWVCFHTHFKLKATDVVYNRTHSLTFAHKNTHTHSHI